jgi:dTDP-4-dehydrorhamnose reductase
VTTVITGAAGQLARALRSRVPDARFLDAAALDISSVDDVRHFDWRGVTTIINAAAYTKVDDCETRNGFLTAWSVNSQGVANLAATARHHDLVLVHLSSDYVFDRVGGPPCTEDEPVRPASAYGASKAAGDLAAQSVDRHYLVRTSWLYHPCGRNFVGAMLAAARRGKQVEVVNDQMGRPTHADDLADVLVELLRRGAPFGTYHVQNDGPVISWADFARAIFATAGLPTVVVDVSTEQYEERLLAADPHRPVARRPRYSALSLDKLGGLGIRVPTWADSLADSLESFPR